MPRSNHRQKPRGGPPGDRERDRAPDAAPGAAGAGAGAGAPRPPISPAREWLEEAWHGWMKSVASLAVLALAYVAYSQQWIGEGVAGPILVAVIVLGVIGLAAAPVVELLEGRPRVLFIAFLAVWAIAAGYPPLRTAVPGTRIGFVTLGETKAHLTDEVSLPGERGPYELTVGGDLKGSGETEVSYKVTVAGEGGTGDEAEGVLKRTFVHQRVGRRGGTATVRQEHTENVHRLDAVRGSTLKVQIEAPDDLLEHGLTLGFRRAALPKLPFLVLAALCVLVALFIDYRLAEPKVKTYLGMAAGVTAVFAAYYPTVATPHFLVPPAVEAVVIAFLTGGLAATFVGFILRSTKPMKKVKGAAPGKAERERERER